MSGNLYCCDQDKCLFLSVLPSEGYEEITWSFKLTSGILKRDSSIPLTLFILKYLTPKCDFCIHDACLIVIHEASLTGTLKNTVAQRRWKLLSLFRAAGACRVGRTSAPLGCLSTALFFVTSSSPRLRLTKYGPRASFGRSSVLVQCTY